MKESHAMDWKAILEELLAERRRALPTPPSVDDCIALRAGTLSEEEREHLLERAAVDPEVARLLFDTLRFPETPDAEEHPPEEDGVGQRWQLLRQRLLAQGDLPAGNEAAPAPMPIAMPKPPWRRWWPLAATFLLGVAAPLLLSRWRTPAELAATVAPRINLPIIELVALASPEEGRRGTDEQTTVNATADGLVLALAVPELDPGAHPGPYSLRIAWDGGTALTLDGLLPGLGGLFVLDLPASALHDGHHQLLLHDREGQEVARFELEVRLQR